MSDDEDNLTLSQLQKIEKNRQKALQIKKSKLVSHPYSKEDSNLVTKKSVDEKLINVGKKSYIDSGAGFLIEKAEKPAENEFQIREEDFDTPMFDDEYPICTSCNKKFEKSWLYKTFDYKVCDECKDPEEMHKLITRSEAMKEYLLKPCDIDKREPLLKFITRKNPHNEHFNDMKLYLQIQIEERALEIWGSEEKLEEELQKREEKRVATKTKKYNKKMKELRMSVRSQLYNKVQKGFHNHEFGEEMYDEDKDEYLKKCITCGYILTFEKL